MSKHLLSGGKVIFKDISTIRIDGLSEELTNELKKGKFGRSMHIDIRGGSAVDGNFFVIDFTVPEKNKIELLVYLVQFFNSKDIPCDLED